LRGFLEMISYDLAVRPLVFGLASAFRDTIGISEFNPDFAVCKAPVEKVRLLHRLYRTVETLNAQRLEQAMRYLSALSGGKRVTIPGHRWTAVPEACVSRSSSPTPMTEPVC